MTQTYRAMIEETIKPRGWPAQEIAFASELVYVIRKDAKAASVRPIR